MRRILCVFLCLLLLSVQITAVEKPENLNTLVTRFISEKGLNPDTFSLYFYNVDSGEEYRYNEDAFFPVGTVWTLPLHMYYYEQEALGAFDAPEDEPDFVYQIGKMTLDQCRYHSILLGESEVARQMRDELGTQSQYKLLINETYGHYSAQELPASYPADNAYSAKFLMNCLRALSRTPEHFGDLIKNFSMVQTGDGFAAFDKPYSLTHILGTEDGFLCDVGEIVAPSPYLLVCFVAEEAGGNEILADINALFCRYVEQCNGISESTAPSRADHCRNDSDFIVTSSAASRSAVLHWIVLALCALGVLSALVALIVLLLRRRRNK